MLRTAPGVIALAAVLCLLALDRAASPAMADGRGAVSRDGRVGPLVVGRSGRRAVRRFAGRPTRIQRGKGEGGARFVMYRYRCGSGCTTYFFFDGDGRLANFITRSRRYRTTAGTRIGQTEQQAEAREGAPAKRGPCSSDYGINRSGRAQLHIGITRGRVRVLAVAGTNSVLGC
ncbi:MAG: hypothetical protein M3296_00995 [Actinomycetota bacterium]|nr:hypothetical protein [Actinomycetota bacterium]